MSDNIKEQGFFKSLNTEGFNAKPPFFPLLLSVIPVDFLSYFNSICFLIILCVSCLTIDKTFSQFGVKVLCFIFIAFGTPLLLVHSFLWTEPLFIVLLAIQIYLIFRYFDAPEKEYIIISIAVCSALLTMVRHAGIFIILGTFVGLLFCVKSKKEIRLACYYGAFSILPFVLWNTFQSKGFSKRYADLLTPVTHDRFSIYKENIFNYLDQLPQWILPPIFPLYWEVAVFVLYIIGIGLIFFKSILKVNEKRFFAAIAMIFVSYYGCMHTMYAVIPSDIERYLAPVFVIFGIVTFKAVELSIPKLARFLQTKYIYIIFALLLLAYPLFRTIKNAVFFYQSGCST